MAVLAAVRERKARRIVESRRRAVHHFGDQRERLKRPGAKLFEQQEGCEIAEAALVREGEHRAQPLLVDVHRPHVMLRRHGEAPHLANRTRRIGARNRQQGILRGARAAIHQVHHDACVLPDDGGVGVGGEVPDRCRVPVIAAGEPAVFVQSLLHDCPVAVRGQDERVEVDLKAVGDGVVVDAGGQPADPDERVAVKARAIRQRAQFLRRVA